MSFLKVLFTIKNNKIQIINISKRVTKIKLVGAIFLGFGLGYIAGCREQKEPEE
jgi:hypothetical protein